MSKTFDLGEKWIIGLTGAMALFALCGVVVGSLQWQTYKGQLEVMQGQLNQMKDTHLLNETHTLADNAGKQVGKLKDLVTATQTAANAAKSAATAASNQLADFESAERAILQLKISWDEAEQTLSYTVKNVGRTTAVDITASGGGGGEYPCSDLQNFKGSPLGLKPDPSPVVGFTLGAGDTTEPIELSHFKPAPKLRIDDGKHCMVYIYRVGYRDIFGKEGNSVDCMVYLGTQGFRKCFLMDD